MLLALALAAGVTAPAAARTTVNPPGRLVLGPAGPSQVPLRTSSANVLNVGLAAGAVQLDSVWYDLQDMGSMGEHVVVGPDGRVHVSWQDEFCELNGLCPPNLLLPNPHPNRGQAYAYRDAGGTWHNLGKVSDPQVAALRCCANPDPIGGFGSIALAPSGQVAIAQHINEESCDLRAQFYYQDAPLGATWSAQIPTLITNGAPTSYLFPQVAARPSGGFTLMGESPVAGGYDEVVQIGVNYFPTTNPTFTCFQFGGGDWLSPIANSYFRDGRPAFPAIAASSNGRVGIAVGDFGGNVYLVESSNGSFLPGTVTIRNLTGYTDAQVTKGDSTSAQYRPYVHCAIAYNDTTPNVVWSELQARKIGSTVEYFDWHSRIRHWDSVRGIETVYQVPAGVADQYDNVFNGLNGPLCGFNTITVDWPQVGFSEDGSEMYVAWLRFTDAEVDPTADMQLTGICTGIGFGDIACSVARGAGAWSAPENLTNTPKCDERFFSLAQRNPGGKLHLVFQASATDQAGSAIIGDRGPAPGNILRRIAYLEKRPAASVLAVSPGTTGRGPSLRVFPNPVFGAARVRIDAAPGTPANRHAEIYGIDGRRIATLPLASGSVLWDARTAAGGRVPSGVYFARISDDPASSAVRFVIAR